MIRVSLLASATGLPARRAAIVGPKAHGPARGHDQEVNLWIGSDPHQVIGAVRGGQTRRAGLELGDLCLERRRRAAATRAPTSNSSGCQRTTSSVWLADRAGTAQQPDALHAATAQRAQIQDRQRRAEQQAVHPIQ